MSTTTDTDDIRRELQVLARRLEQVESQLAGNGVAIPDAADLGAQMSNVREITQALFPGRCEFTSEFDPEYPDDRYVVVNVEAKGEPRDIVDRTCEWHARILNLSDGLHGRLRLSVVPV